MKAAEEGEAKIIEEAEVLRTCASLVQKRYTRHPDIQSYIQTHNQPMVFLIEKSRARCHRRNRTQASSFTIKTTTEDQIDRQQRLR